VSSRPPAAASGRAPGRPPSTSHARIRELALTLFEQRGYDDTSLSAIAQAAGISRTTLFGYFPAKRDLLREEFDDRAQRLRRHIAADPSGPAVQLLVDAVCVVAQYRAHEHAGLARRMRIVEGSQELRALIALLTGELAHTVMTFVAERAPGCDPVLIGDLTHALMRVAARATEDWARAQAPEQDLDAYVAQRLRPLAEALAPLLPSTASTGPTAAERTAPAHRTDPTG